MTRSRSRGVLSLIFLVSVRLFATDLSTRAWEILSAGMADQNPAKRAQAVTAVGTIGLTRRAISAVESALTDKDPLVRQTAAAVLADMKSYRSIGKLKRALSDDTPEVKFTAAKALWELGDRSGRDILMNVLAGEASDKSVKSEMRGAKREIHSPAALAKMGSLETARALLGPFSLGVGFAEDLMKDRGAPARALAAKLLGNDSDPESLSELEQALYDKNPGVRAVAVRAFAQRSTRKAVPKLEPLLADRSDAPRYMAAAAIVKLTKTAKSVAAPRNPSH